MVARGHKLHDLLCVYPISTLNDLATAARFNERESHVVTTNGFLAAVMHGLDSAFNSGKNKIMKKYMSNMYPTKSKDHKDAADKLLKFFAPKG